VVFAAAADDAVAAQIVDRLASEVVALSRVALERLDLTEQPVELLLGGGLLQAGDGRLLDRIEAGMREVGSEIAVRRSSSPPIVGAVLLALDAISAPPEAQGRARDQVGQSAGGAERMPVG
jgi:N-acetylglucosamine kinase-like BadF-type ATPase